MSTTVKPEDLDIEQLKAETKKLFQSNTDKQKSLIQMTGGVPDEGVIASIKMEVFIETFLDERAKAVYAYNLQVKLRQLLDEDLKKLRQAQLTEGLPASKSLLLPR